MRACLFLPLLSFDQVGRNFKFPAARDSGEDVLRSEESIERPDNGSLGSSDAVRRQEVGSQKTSFPSSNSLDDDVFSIPFADNEADCVRLAVARHKGLRRTLVYIYSL